MTRELIDGRIARDGNRGFLMRNDRKDFSAASEEERRKPDYTGRLHCGGVLYFVAAWVKKTVGRTEHAVGVGGIGGGSGSGAGRAAERGRRRRERGAGGRAGFAVLTEARRWVEA